MRPPGRPKAVPEGQTEEDILLIASHLFMNHGYDGVSIEGVAHAALVTKAAIYYYFPTKADLFVAALSRLLEVIERQTARILAEDLPLRARLLKLTQIRLQVSDTRFDFNRVMEEASPSLQEVQRQTLHEHLDNLVITLTHAFENAAKKGEIPPSSDPRFLSHAYLALLALAYSRDRNGNRIYSGAVAADLIVSMLWGGISNPSQS